MFEPLKIGTWASVDEQCSIRSISHIEDGSVTLVFGGHDTFELYLTRPALLALIQVAETALNDLREASESAGRLLSNWGSGPTSSTTQCAGMPGASQHPNLNFRVPEHYYLVVERVRAWRGFRGLAGIGALVTACALAVGSTGCGAIEADDGKPTVLTTFTVLADIAANVAGEHLTVESITKPGAEIHGYEPTPGDIKKAAKADLILDNGMNLEAWFSQFVEDSEAAHVTVSDGVEPMSITEDAYQGKPNPHAWMSPLNVRTYVDNMVTAFSELDPDHAADFRANGDKYKAELQRVNDELVADLSVLPQHQRALVTCEGAFSYLARDAGLTEKYIWPVNAEQQATPQQITSAIEFVRANQVPAVFCESTVSDAPMRRVVEATGATFGGVLYVDSLSAPDGPVPTYLELIRHDADLIGAALTGSKP